MKKNIKIEAEGQELVLRNKVGDFVIIPKKHRRKVQDMLKENCHSCIDALVDTLPIMEDYAQDGSLYSEYLTQDPPGKKRFLEPNPDGSLPSYFKGSDENPIELNEVIITAKAPDWVKYKKDYLKNNPFNIDKYVEDRFNNPVGREKIEKIDQEGWKKKLRREGLERRYNATMDYVGEQLVLNKPQGEMSRAEWLNTMSDKEEKLIKRNPKYQSSLWADTKRGLTSLMEQNPLQAFQNILNSPDYSDREKREMLKDYIDHPVMSKLGDFAKILNPLTVPSKMVQSAYKDDYSLGDALKGKKNKAGIVEDIITDPLNLVGLGIWSKLSKAGKFDKLEDAYKAVKGLSKEKAIAKLSDETIDITSKIGNPVNRKMDIHDIRKKYHNDLPLTKEESKILKEQGKGLRKNYRNIIGEDMAGKMHIEDIPSKPQRYDKHSIEEKIFGKDHSAEKVSSKTNAPKGVSKSSNDLNKDVFENHKLNISNKKDEILELIKDLKTNISPFERTETSMKADKWLSDWFYNPETKKAFINYGGTEDEWINILNTLDNPIRSSVKYGKNQPGGVYNKLFNQASIPIDAKVDVGVHEGIHKTGLLLTKRNPILNNLWNDFIDAVREIPTESYPEIFRLRYNLGLKPGQKIDIQTLEKGLKTIADGYSIPYKIKDKNKLLDIINKAPALAPFLGMYLQSEQNKPQE